MNEVTSERLEMRFATSGEIEDGKLWRIPAERMKMQAPHLVPLSKQARRVLALARPLRQSDDPGVLLFPGFTRHGALSENALLALLADGGAAHVVATWLELRRDAAVDQQISAVDEDVVPVVSVSVGDLSAAFSFGSGFGFAATLGAVAGLPATGGRAGGAAASGLLPGA